MPKVKKSVEHEAQAKLDAVIKQYGPQIKTITKEIGQNFRCFGGGSVNMDNPISRALVNDPLQFAAAVDVEQVVTFVIFRLFEKTHI